MTIRTTTVPAGRPRNVTRAARCRRVIRPTRRWLTTNVAERKRDRNVRFTWIVSPRRLVQARAGAAGAANGRRGRGAGPGGPANGRGAWAPRTGSVTVPGVCGLVVTVIGEAVAAPR